MSPNCNLELQLFPVNDSDYDTSNYNHQNDQSFAEESNRSPKHERQQPQPQPLTTIFPHHHHLIHQSLEADSSRSHGHERPLTTIFFDERVRLFDLQSKDLPLVASQKMDEAMKSSDRLGTQLCSPINLSMKRSLKSFLQKRKLRIQATSPYTIKDSVEGLSSIRTGKLPI